MISTPGQEFNPADFTSTAPLSEAWGLQLSGGLRCLQFFGSTNDVDDKPIRYFCADNGTTGLLDGTLNTSKTARWTIGTAVLNHKTLQWHLGPRVSIVKAWYFVDRSRTS
jgi:hypothetical protein